MQIKLPLEELKLQQVLQHQDLQLLMQQQNQPHTQRQKLLLQEVHLVPLQHTLPLLPLRVVLLPQVVLPQQQLLPPLPPLPPQVVLPQLQLHKYILNNKYN
jgi:hypothetical protein